MDTEVKMIFPKYLKEFVCIGSACSDSCCVGWRVDIDKSTFQHYKNYQSGNEKLQQLFAKCVTRNRTNPSDERYAKIKMDANGACPFMDGQKLCSIQSEMGMEALSMVCMVYPRKYARINKVIELNATLSCPEIARLALLNPEGLELVFEPLSMYPKAKYSLDRVLNTKNQYAFAVKYYYDIQATAIMILQYRQVSIEKRLMMLGMFTEKLFNLFSGRDGEIKKVIGDFGDSNILNAYTEEFMKIKPKYTAQLILLQEMSLKALEAANQVFSQNYIAYISTAINTLYGAHRSDQQVLYDYQHIGIPKYQKFMEEKAYILENYCVNTLFEQYYPINEDNPNQGGNDIFLSYIRFVIKFSILRTTIIGLLMSCATLDDDDMVILIQTYTKKIHHSTAIINRFIIKMKEEGNYALAMPMILLNI